MNTTAPVSSHRVEIEFFPQKNGKDGKRIAITPIKISSNVVEEKDSTNNTFKMTYYTQIA